MNDFTQISAMEKIGAKKRIFATSKNNTIVINLFNDFMIVYDSKKNNAKKYSLQNDSFNVIQSMLKKNGYILNTYINNKTTFNTVNQYKTIIKQL